MDKSGTPQDHSILELGRVSQYLEEGKFWHLFFAGSSSFKTIMLLTR